MNELPGTVVADDFTKGHKAPRTISNLPGVPEFWWGRQDLSVYIVSGPLFLLALITLGWWWPVVMGAFPGVGGAVICTVILVGIPFAAGAAAAMFNLNSRDIPRHIGTVGALLPRPGSGALSAHSRPAPEPRMRFAPSTWLLPEDES